MTSQTDGDKHTTKYVRNVLEQVTETTDPLLRTTTKEYDPAGNLKMVTDPAKRTTIYTYDRDNRLTGVKYSDGKTPSVKYEYDKDGNLTVMVDGTGTTNYTYDQLDRLTETKDGHGDVSKHEYNLANENTAITYPNGKTVTRSYDKADRLEKITDWLSNATKFTYDADSNLVRTIFPTSTGNEDTYAYNLADQISEIKMLKGTETLASVIYARDAGGQIASAIDKGLPDGEITETTYDQNNRVTKSAGTSYEYDLGNNPTKIGSSTYKYNSANELESGTGVAYTYDEMGERTKATPTIGPATTYGYDQAGRITSVMRPKEGETSAIEDSYTYDGHGLRASQTASGVTTYFAWDPTEKLPLILSYGSHSFIYGPEGLPIEQINGEEKVQCLHHDQQGSTRVITGSTGTVEGSYTYTAYGAVEGHTGTATAALGYDGQYTNSDTGLIYLRARTYDPVTAQFMTVDPEAEKTNSPYGYAQDDPLTIGDPTGLIPWSPKVKQAVAVCRSWKAWHSKKSPFYGNHNVYYACLDLLSLPSEVYGTSGTTSLSTFVKVGLGCSLGGATVSQVTRSAARVPEAVGVYVAFCGGYVFGEMVADPVLHKLAPSIFAE
ncbi:MAG TPA: RHS repeat-associated core domain-containing protein [Solirubrobacteraceae bacterium]